MSRCGTMPEGGEVLGNVWLVMTVMAGGPTSQLPIGERINQLCYAKIRNELHQLAENNREVEAGQIDIKIDIVRFFGFLLYLVQPYRQRIAYGNALRESLTSSGKPTCRAIQISPYRPARASLRAEISSQSQPPPVEQRETHLFQSPHLVPDV